MRSHTYMSFFLKAAIILASALQSFDVAGQEGSISGLSPQEFSAGSYRDVGQDVGRDIGLLRTYIDNMEKTMRIIEGDKVLFDRNRKRDLDIQERKKLYTLWGNYLDHILAIEQLAGRYKDFHAIKDKRRGRNAFFLAFASYMAKLSYGFRFIHLTIDNEFYEKKLDDPNLEYGIPGGLYAKLKWNTIHMQDVTNVLAGYQYFKFLKKTYIRQVPEADKRISWLLDYIDREYEYISGELKVRGPRYFAVNGLDILKDKTFAAWFPVQMNVSEWMGDTKVKRQEHSLISLARINEMEKHLMPGDIIVERRNWYLSNIGLPGFWPHAELYIGTYEVMKRFFDDGAVISHYRSKGPYKDFIDYLNKKHPSKMKAFVKKAPDGFPHQIIEAVSEGVKFSTLPEGTSADYIGVMRPRLSKLDIAMAIDEAFNYLGRPYDFNFDFLTDGSIVCSELIYKVYLGGKDKKGLRLVLREIAGRKAIPTNDIVEKFDREFDTDERELDFVYFLDGSEKDKKSEVKGLSEFRLSHKRLKWDIAQK